MATRRLFLCGPSRLSSRKKMWRDAKQVRLRIGGRSDNVQLRISDITRPLTANLSNRELDLLEIATYVYCADQTVRRGGLKQFDYGGKWHRQFRLQIAVRDPDFWSDVQITGELCDALNVASGDDFEFGFTRLKDRQPIEAYFDYGDEVSDDIAEVVLFSGGLDSFGGAVRETLALNRRIVLVSHRSVTTIGARQRTLFSKLAERAADPGLRPIHVPVTVNKDKKLSREPTQRTRSFLYAVMAATIARLFGRDRIQFCENGVTSINLPISAQVVGTRATRRAHPMVLNAYERIISRVVDARFQIHNPFVWKTKSEVLRLIKENGCDDLCAITGSCVHTWSQTKQHSHCGICSQCVDSPDCAIHLKHSIWSGNMLTGLPAA